MAHRPGYAAVLAVAAVLGACTANVASPSAPATTATTSSVRLLAGRPLTPCTISGERPVRAKAAALCGTLRVPEDRSKPQGRTIDLRVAVVPSTAAHPASDPLFALAGGPGEASTQFFAWMPSVFTDVLRTRDIVLVDQRGTGASNAVQLPEMPDTTGLPAKEADARLTTWARGAIGSADIDPRQYTSIPAADDLDAVRAALGHEKIDLYGASYGGTLAQYYLRRHGEHVRVAVLDGSTPVDVPVLERIATSSQAAVDLLLRRCTSDPSCRQAFPQVEKEWAALVERLRTPITVVDPASGEKAVIDQALLAEAIHAALLVEGTAAQVPLTVHLAHQSRWVEAAQVLGAPTSGGPTMLAADEILCSEAWARDEPAAVAREGAGSYALQRELARARERATMCRYLPRGVVSPDDGVAVRTSTPVLWLTADGDPQDPPANLAAVPAKQPRSRIVVMPAQQHVVGHLGCLPSVVAGFLVAGRADLLDTSCVAAGGPAPPFRVR
jgi:pimeloyl-ACP methyl ester carboxylesterase